VIVLRSGERIDPEEIERHYAQSLFIKTVRVHAAAGPDAGHRLRAVIIPDVDVLRRKRIVNVRELIRFELEGLSVALPDHQRVLDFDVSMPSASTGDVPPPLAWLIETVQQLVPRPVTVYADSNFELDLGLDSIERVELLVAVEQRLGMRLAGEAVQCAFTVRELAKAAEAELELRNYDNVAAERQFRPWKTILNETSLDAARQARLVEGRPFTAAVLFAALRVLSGLLLRPQVSGLEHLPATGPFILAPNHQSFLDAAVLGGVLPFRVFRRLFFVGATEYFETAFSAWLASRANIVPADPDANLVPALQAGAFGLRAGKILVLFPEGERSIDGTVKQFRRGAGLLAEHLEAPIVPVAIDGMFGLWPRSRPFRWAKLLPWSGHRVRIAFGPPLSPRNHAKLRQEVDRMWNELHAE
jgi:long-chain acyl-CoA synthetase